MLRVRYSTDEIEIEADSLGFEQLRQAIKNINLGGSETLVPIQCDVQYEPYPYSGKAKAIHLFVEGAFNYFRIEDDCLIITGSRENLENLAANLPINGHEKPHSVPYHVHYDSLTSPVDPRSPEGITFTFSQGNQDSNRKPI